MHEDRKQQRLRLLWVFRIRQIPHPHEKLFLLAGSDDKEIQSAAISALKNHKHLEIRGLAIQLTHHSNPGIALQAIALLINNYRDGDYQLIQPLLRTITDPNTTNNITRDILAIYTQHPQTELADYLLWAYENSHCSHCKAQVTQKLIVGKMLPNKLLIECQFD